VTDAERHVRLFRNSRNQALRIPREFELEGHVKRERFPFLACRISGDPLAQLSSHTSSTICAVNTRSPTQQQGRIIRLSQMMVITQLHRRKPKCHFAAPQCIAESFRPPTVCFVPQHG
jgi:hypothetical protein